MKQPTLDKLSLAWIICAFIHRDFLNRAINNIRGGCFSISIICDAFKAAANHKGHLQ